MFPLCLQARIEAVGQVLMWKAVEAAPGLQRLGRRSRRPARAASDRYEEHMLLPDDRVALLTSQRLMLVSAPGFAKVGSHSMRSSATPLALVPGSQTGRVHNVGVGQTCSRPSLPYVPHMAHEYPHRLEVVLFDD